MVGSSSDGPNLGWVGSTGFVATMGGLVVAAGAILAVLRYARSEPFEQGLEGALGALALGTVVAAPGIAALLGLRRRPALLLPAGVVLVPLSFLSFAGLTLPLLIPATMLCVAYVRRSPAHSVGPARAALTTVTVLLFLVAAGIALFVHQDPRSYATATSSGSTSDVISIQESLASLSLVGAALGFGWLLAERPRPRTQLLGT